jgi:hypothetical protein
MDVTPTDHMFHAMQRLVDAACGEEPHPMLLGAQADLTRVRRRLMMDALHRLIAVAMREGVNRAIRDAQARKDGFRDEQDRSAAAKARDDAQAGSSIVTFPKAH